MNLLWHLFFYRPQGDLLGTFHGYFCLNLPSSRCLQLFSQLHNLLLQRLQIPNNLQKPVTWILQGQLRQAQPKGDRHGDCGGARGVGDGWHDALIWFCDNIFTNCLCQYLYDLHLHLINIHSSRGNFCVSPLIRNMRIAGIAAGFPSAICDATRLESTGTSPGIWNLDFGLCTKEDDLGLPTGPLSDYYQHMNLGVNLK